ncbi:pacifastin-like protease inhibitor cvp4 [Photinus pyralis]|uniref:pacifastin-like protease inhibitor cvp4 n=1 Tax=Photinus pyralis TaxID=7054 RepID=UPI0012675E20|nr:pacifastin-like protease inhibitor cvp4 [Photinus pyralis]
MKFQLFFLIAALVVYVSAEHDWTCQKGVSYIENDCNNCQCIDGGLACARSACVHEEHNEMVKCTEFGKEFVRGCNTCVCTEKYHTVCTNEKCHD